MNEKPQNRPGADVPLRVVAWETTRQCNLDCIHCRAAASHGRPENELTTQEGRGLILQIAERAKPLLILSGGEPLMRPDIFDLARIASNAGLKTVLATNATLLEAEHVRRMRNAGVLGVSVSFDGPDAETHDRVRASKGAFERSLRGLALLRKDGMPFQINFTVCRENADRLDGMIALAEREGAHTLDVFMLVPTGRARNGEPLGVSARQYEAILRNIARRADDAPITLRVTCGPHYQRILREMNVTSGVRASGCMAGTSFVFVSHRGEVFPCGYLDVSCGDARRDGFWKVWDESPVLRSLRNRSAFKGKCGRCEYVEVCGGCRARAFGLTGDYLAPEPLCAYQPEAAPHSAAGSER